MNQPLPFFNWSLKKALDTQSDSFIRAQIRIIYTMLLVSLLKGLVVVFSALNSGQSLQLSRALMVIPVYILLMKLLLCRPSQVKRIAHTMIIAGILVVWTSIIFYSHNINILTVQFVFMIILCSFYTLGTSLGFVYSVISCLPVIVVLLLKGNIEAYVVNTPETFASPGFEILVILNFISYAISHYLFYKAFSSNIREKEKLNHQLQLAIADAEKLAESKSNFLSTMSHELRTPLNAVIGITEIMLQTNREEAQKENLKILQFSSQDLLALINNVLDFNKTEADKLVLEAVPFNLAGFLRSRWSGLSIIANEKKIDFHAAIDQRLENINVISDPTRLSQVIYNLVSNAIKFTDSGSVTIKLDCLARTEHSVDVQFSIIDTGIGIHPDRHEAVFDLFTQAETDTTRHYGGTGLGLPIVRRVLALFNSSVQLESSPGEGSRFFFTISFPTGATTINTDAAADITEPVVPGHLKILIAEDNEVNRLLLRKQMEILKLNPVIVENGQQAYEAFLSDDYDVILLDLHMPVLDGYETIKLIRAFDDPKKASVHMIAFSASISGQDEILETGFDDFLQKPVNMKEFREKLSKTPLGKPLSQPE